MAAGAGDALDTARRATGWTLSLVFFVAWQFVRIVICIVLVFIEPVLRWTLVPFGFVCFFMSIIVGFIGGASNFPKWGMLAFGIGCVFVYWLYMGLMSLFMELPRDIDDRRYR